MICADVGQYDTKKMWMDFIYRLNVIDKGGEVDSRFLNGMLKTASSMGAGLNCDEGGDPNFGPGEGGTMGGLESKKRDGQWLIIKNWTACNKECGGGESKLERVCIPPKYGGKPCYGPGQLARPCNTQPCPGVEGEEDPVINLPEKTTKTEIVMKQMSERPNRYEECVVREGDLAQLRDDLTGFPEFPRIPVRAVLNNKTFIVYNSDNYDSTS